MFFVCFVCFFNPECKRTSFKVSLAPAFDALHFFLGCIASAHREAAAGEAGHASRDSDRKIITMIIMSRLHF